MVTIEIKKGELKSDVYTLAHKEVCAILVPSVSNTYFSILGGFEPNKLGLIQTSESKWFMGFLLSGQLITFDSQDFEGVMYLQFQVDTPHEVSLIFDVMLK